jgi:hypothetical protein
MMDDRRAACWFAVTRVGLGVALATVPRVVEGWVGPVARRPEAKVLTRIAGARDIALGVGTLLALREGTPARRWLQVAAAVDATDALASLGALRHLTARRSLPAAALAASGAATGIWLSGRLT